MPHSITLVLFVALLMGLAQIFWMPPFEGFDESAHYSSIVQIAETRNIPRLGSARLAVEVEHYQTIGPRPYASHKPYADNGGLTYEAFFAQPI